MKHYLTLLFGLMVFTITNAQTVGTFTKKTHLGNEFVGRSGAAMFSTESDLYIFGGRSAAQLDFGVHDFAKYNPTSGTLTKLPSLSHNEGKLRNMFKVGDYVYYFDQWQSFGVSRYSISNNVWAESIYPNMPGITVDTGFVIGTTIYLVCYQWAMPAAFKSFYAYDTTTDTFTQKADYPGDPRGGAFAFAIDGKGYFGAGYTNVCPSSNCYFRDFYEYDPATDSWTQKTDFPPARSGASAIAVNGKGYAGLGGAGGTSTNPYSSPFWYEYDPVANTWTGKQNFLNLSADQSNDPFFINYASTAAIGSDIYIYGGRTMNGDKHALYKYNTLTNEWTIEKPEMGGNREGASGVMINDKLYVGGGKVGNVWKSFYEYDPATDNWTQKADFPDYYEGRNGVALNGKAYFLGGRSQTRAGEYFSQDLWEYDPVTDSWTQKAFFPAGRRGSMGIVAYDGKIYAGLGVGTTASLKNDLFSYDPATNTWTTLATAPSYTSNNHQFRTSSFLLGDYAYFIKDNYGYLDSANKVLRYSFSDNTWTGIDAQNLQFDMTSDVNNAFSYNGKGYYVMHNQIDGKRTIMEFNPADNTFSNVAKIPFSCINTTHIATEEGVYIGFGYTGYNLGYTPINGSPTSNQLYRWELNPAVSTETGIHTFSSDRECGFTRLNTGEYATIADPEGRLFFQLRNNNVDIQHPICIEINSTNNSYRSLTADLGNGLQDVMFANKSFLVKSGHIYPQNTLSIYFTSEEMTNFVEAFNTQYSTNKTINDIRFLSYGDNHNYISDHDPLNNNNQYSQYIIHPTTLGDYNGGNYLQFTVASYDDTYFIDEVYVTLFHDSPLSNESFTKDEIVLYPNPTKDVVTIEGMVLKTATVVDVSGKTIAQYHTNSIDLQHLQDGIYFLRLEDENGIVSTKKVIKKQ